MPDILTSSHDRRQCNHDLIFGYHLCVAMVWLMVAAIGLLHRFAGINIALGNAILAVVPFLIVVVGIPVGAYVFILSLKHLADWHIMSPAGLLALSAVLLTLSELTGKAAWLEISGSLALILYVFVALALSLHWFLYRRKRPDRPWRSRAGNESRGKGL